MLIPNKYTNLDNSILKIGGDILRILTQREIVTYDEVLTEVTNLNGNKSKINYLYSLNLLFLLGKIEYFEKEDMLKIK